MTNYENIPQIEIVREFKSKYGREIALMLISERINNRNLSKEDRDVHEMQLIQAYMDRQGVNDKYIGELDILDMIQDFETMVQMSVYATNILKKMQVKNYNMAEEISYFSREDDLNNLWLAKLEIEKLIKAIEKNRPNYINFYK
ncbi:MULTISPECIES: hypothetical protein [unclassified Staphylococcus]|uniref:hypothetical protein n=1 Tax=unclassified Staphylococcus TaxID=91994 RepID=UPI001011F46A|nr:MULTISPECIES: hypothetical protein [unclassified Staphylococcus]MBL0377634.1 hypothetical protein [Staphylococcus sp. S75]MBL0384166.1 hypothetical protein [Staphylococcus sp. S59]MBL0401950.1 hypothetical protein [Staphylococcus sp. S36]RXZ27343.1 hypothetical protein ESM34_08830 [Staphylococcus sp. SNAZ 59]RXZ32673.1 hypothetical protein ESM33_11155 [Staphylococcus sp. SNAZ 36]